MSAWDVAGLVVLALLAGFALGMELTWRRWKPEMEEVRRKVAALELAVRLARMGGAGK